MKPSVDEVIDDYKSRTVTVNDMKTKYGPVCEAILAVFGRHRGLWRDPLVEAAIRVGVQEVLDVLHGR